MPARLGKFPIDASRPMPAALRRSAVNRAPGPYPGPAAGADKAQRHAVAISAVDADRSSAAPGLARCIDALSYGRAPPGARWPICCRPGGAVQKIMTISPSPPKQKRGHHRASAPGARQDPDAQSVSPWGISTGTSGVYSPGTHTRPPESETMRSLRGRDGAGT